MKIQLLVDHKTRDLKANILVGAHLAKNGAKVILTPTAIMEKEIFSLNANHVVFNYLRSNNEHLISKVLKTNKCASILDTEGGFFIKLPNEKNIPNFIKTFPASNRVSKHIQNYFVWGRDVHNYLKTTNYFDNSCLKLTGTPRSDLIYRASISNTERFNILINTSFTLANPKYKTPEEEAEYLVKAYNYESSLTYGVLKAQKLIMAEYVKLAIKISKEFPHKNIIFRPHPFENCSLYRELLSQYSNIKITNTEPIDQALSKARVLIHYQCSTAMEAMLMGIPALSLSAGSEIRPIEIINNLTEYHDTHESLLKSISGIFNNTYTECPAKKEILKNSIENIYFKFDNSSSYRIATILVETPSRPVSVKSKIFNFLFLLNASIKYAVKHCQGKNNLDESKFFSVNDVNLELSMLNLKGLKVEKIKNSILIQSL